MTSRDTKIIDLGAYRARRAEELARNGNVSAGIRSDQVQMTAMSFLMPAVYFVFWPTWVFVPQFGQGQPDRSNGCA